MEAKKKSGPSAAAAAGAGAAPPPPPNGYFSSVFSSSPAGNAKDAKQTDLYAMLNKQSSRGQTGSSITANIMAALRTRMENKFIQLSRQNPLTLVHPCITVVGSSTAALHRSKPPMKPLEITKRTIRMALLLEVIGGKVHYITE